MCGIAGIFHYETVKPVDPKRVERMTEALTHRGPDGSGVWTAPGVGLHCRTVGPHPALDQRCAGRTTLGLGCDAI